MAHFSSKKCALKYMQAFAVFLILALIAGVTLDVTVAAEHRGMCGGGESRPSCAMFAFGLNIYGMIGLSAAATLTTVVTYAVRRRPPVLLKVASLLSGAAIGALVLLVWAAGNRLAGAMVIMIVAPLVVSLLGGASLCVLLWLAKAAGGWIERRVGSPDKGQVLPRVNH